MKSLMTGRAQIETANSSQKYFKERAVSPAFLSDRIRIYLSLPSSCVSSRSPVPCEDCYFDISLPSNIFYTSPKILLLCQQQLAYLHVLNVNA